jgi:tRNA1Val (adenine37-N6)-methyltransferase
MKVGTDGVLLGSWADIDWCKNILDVGTGCGLIALMAAQRNTQASVYGIDIDVDSTIQAQENIEASPFAQRIKIVQCDIKHWKPDFAFDAILSNPPFYEEDLLPPNTVRSKARHTQAGGLTLEELVVNAYRLLKKRGIFTVVLPHSIAEKFEGICCSYRLYLQRRTNVITCLGKMPKRCLLEFHKEVDFGGLKVDTLVLADKSGQRSCGYHELTKEFYL